MDPCRMEVSTEVPCQNSVKCLEDLLDEILEEIFRHMDGETFAALALTNKRMRRISQTALRFKKIAIGKATPSVCKYFGADGSLLRRLDLSNFRSPSTVLESLIEKCPNITELNLINSPFESLDCIRHLRKLETLCMSALEISEPDLSKCRGALASVKKLYLDIGPVYKTVIYSLKVMNLCEAIEFVYLHVTGYLSGVYRYRGVPLDAARWKTLRTVIMTQHISSRFHTQKMLGDVFCFNETPGIIDWIDEDKDCYIYEDGRLNGYLAGSSGDIGDVKYLSKVHESYFTDDTNADLYLRSTYGSPRSVRIRGFYGFPAQLLGSPSATLKELDISGCHTVFENEFRLSLLELLPSLESLACSLCFAVHTSARDPAAEHVSRQQQAFNEALKRLNLRELRLNGLTHCECCGSGCICSFMHARKCTACRSEIILSSRNLVDLSSFGDLELFSLSGGDLHASAYGNMINPNVRTVRLLLNNASDFSGLQEFLQRCVNLRYLKFEAMNITVSYEPVWRALLEAPNLRGLCLRLRHFRRADPGWETSAVSDGSFDCLLRLLEKLEYMHLHCAQKKIIEGIRERLRGKFDEEKLRSCLFFNDGTFDSRHIIYNTEGKRLPDQGLCYGESFAGVVPPVGWTAGQ